MIKIFDMANIESITAKGYYYKRYTITAVCGTTALSGYTIYGTAYNESGNEIASARKTAGADGIANFDENYGGTSINDWEYISTSESADNFSYAVFSVTFPATVTGWQVQSTKFLTLTGHSDIAVAETQNGTIQFDGISEQGGYDLWGTDYDATVLQSDGTSEQVVSALTIYYSAYTTLMCTGTPKYTTSRVVTEKGAPYLVTCVHAPKIHNDDTFFELDSAWGDKEGETEIRAIKAYIPSGRQGNYSWAATGATHRIGVGTTAITSTTLRLSLTGEFPAFERGNIKFCEPVSGTQATGGKWKIYNTVSSARTDEANMIWSGWVTSTEDDSAPDVGRVTITGDTDAVLVVERDGFETFIASATSIDYTDSGDSRYRLPYRVNVNLQKSEDEGAKLGTISNIQGGSAWKTFGNLLSGSIDTSDENWKDRVMMYNCIYQSDSEYPPFADDIRYNFIIPSYYGTDDKPTWEIDYRINSGKTLKNASHSIQPTHLYNAEDDDYIYATRAIKSTDILRAEHNETIGSDTSDRLNGATSQDIHIAVSPNGFVDARFVFNGEETTSVPYNWCVSGVQTSGYVMASTLPHKYLTTKLSKWLMASAGTMSGVSGMRAAGPHGVSGDEVYFIVSCVSANTSTTKALTATFNPGRDGVSDSVTVSQSPKPNVTFKGDTAQGTTFLFYFGWDEFGSECAHTATVTLANAVSWSGDIPSSSEDLSVTIPYTSTIVAYPTAKMLAGKSSSGKRVLELYPKAFDRWGNSAYTDGDIRSIMAYISGVPSASGCTIKKINNSTSSTATEVTSLTYLATNSGISAANYFYIHFSAASTYYTYRITTKTISGATNSFYWGYYSQSTMSGYVSFRNYPKSANTSTTPNIVQYTITPISKYKYHDGTYISGVSKTITVTQVAGGGGK